LLFGHSPSDAIAQGVRSAEREAFVGPTNAAGWSAAWMDDADPALLLESASAWLALSVDGDRIDMSAHWTIVARQPTSSRIGSTSNATPHLDLERGVACPLALATAVGVVTSISVADV
jgi:hypothetical protein